MGPTGSGKSTVRRTTTFIVCSFISPQFVCAASGRDTKAISHGLRSYTDQVRAVKFRDEESGRHVVLVDTPGFDDTFRSDLDTVTLISKWLVSR